MSFWEIPVTISGNAKRKLEKPFMAFMNWDLVKREYLFTRRMTIRMTQLNGINYFKKTFVSRNLYFFKLKEKYPSNLLQLSNVIQSCSLIKTTLQGQDPASVFR
jgi:hypothetical protein